MKSRVFFLRTLACAAIASASPLASAAVTLTNPGFEDPEIDPVHSVLYAVNGGLIGGWNYSARVFGGDGTSGSGTAGDGSFDMADAPGFRAGFLQRNASIAQSFTTTTEGLYSVSFLAQGRNNPNKAGAAPLTVSIDGTLLKFGGGTTLNPSLGTFSLFSSEALFLGPGTYTLRFASSAPAGQDRTTFIDNVAINVSPVPEPHEWAMMLAGLGLVGWAARRRQRESAPVGFAAA